MDPKNVLNALKEASPLDLFLLSFIALPFVFDAWLTVLEKLEFELCAQLWILGIIFLGYIIGIALMYVGSSKQRLRELAKHQIISYLTANSYTMMTLETIRKNIDKSYSDDFLNSLPVYFPSDIRRAKLRGNNPGLARIVEENGVDET